MSTTSQPPSEPRWRRIPEERPRQILRAAFDEFGNHGLQAARLDDIAKAAGVSKGTIYLYYPNKEELFREVIRWLVVDRLEDAERRSGADNPVEALKTCVRDYWQQVRTPDFPVLYRLVTSEVPKFPDLAEFYSREVVARKLGWIGGIIRRGQESGDFREIDPAIPARMIASMVVTHALWCDRRSLCPQVRSIPDEQVVDELIEFILAALRPTSTPDASGAPLA
jgi:AcrR family transcriptional regulator